MQISFDLTRIFLNSLEDTGQRFQQFPLGSEVMVVCSGNAGVVPQPLRGIEFRRIRGKLMDGKPVPVFLKPAPDILILVVGGIVLDQMNLVGSRFAAGGRHLSQEAQIRLSIEDRLPAINELGLLEIDGAEDLDAFPGTRHRDERLRTDTGPGLMESRVLPEAGFIFEEDVGSFVPRFFLMLGYL